MWFHIKCGGVVVKDFHLIQAVGKQWTSRRCILTFLPLDISFQSTNNSFNSDNADVSLSAWETEKDPLQDLINIKLAHNNQPLLYHLNINSLQNKFEELKLINDKLKAGIIVLTETKIDSSYMDTQFSLPNYCIYRQDRAKGGGGVLTFIATQIPSKKLKPPRVFKSIEVLAIKLELNNTNTILLGMYRPPHCRGANYYSVLEEELNDCLSWATIQCSTVIIMGDLNLDKLKVNERDAKLLKDLEEVFELTCLITEPTRITASSQTLLDVILTNQPDLFKTAGVINIGLSDHCMVYGFLKEAVKEHSAAVINCRSIKNLDINEFTRDLTDAVSIKQHSTSVGEQYDNWYTELMRIVDKHLPLKRIKV